jgi:hypothetical protein
MIPTVQAVSMIKTLKTIAGPEPAETKNKRSLFWKNFDEGSMQHLQ